MPKSQGRKPPRNTRRTTSSARSGRRPDLLTFAPLVQATNEAEARGDAAGALELVLSRPTGPDGRLFWSPERVRRLSQLYALGPLLPRWSTSRWILAQALQVMEPGNRGRSRRAHETAVRVRGGPGTVRGVDDVDRGAQVADHDWVYRQLFLYELGGLDQFLRRVAAPDLVAGADRIGDWAATPMGGYRLVAETSRELTWEDLATGGETRTINLGATTMTTPGGCVLGRVVPTDEGSMFESAPLVVPEGAALDVARGRRSWVDAVERACHDEYLVADDDDLCITGDFDFALLTDVPDITQHWFQHLAADIPFAAHDECDPPRIFTEFVLAALEGTLQDVLDEELRSFDTTANVAPSVAAALVEPYVGECLLHRLTSTDSAALVALGAQLPRPAADVCVALAEALRAAA